jgi:TfoX/Sxy family transcriptional regulator of competence genes
MPPIHRRVSQKTAAPLEFCRYLFLKRRSAAAAFPDSIGRRIENKKFILKKQIALHSPPKNTDTTMPYNAALDEKLQRIASEWPACERKKMFGGTGYLLNGNMVAGVYKDLLVLRVGKAIEEELLTQPWCRPMDVTGKPMKGWLFVESEAWDDDGRLNELTAHAKDFVATLPPK